VARRFPTKARQPLTRGKHAVHASNLPCRRLGDGFMQIRFTSCFLDSSCARISSAGVEETSCRDEASRGRQVRRLLRVFPPTRARRSRGQLCADEMELRAQRSPCWGAIYRVCVPQQMEGERHGRSLCSFTSAQSTQAGRSAGNGAQFTASRFAPAQSSYRMKSHGRSPYRAAVSGAFARRSSLE
jgi:hypothetical protein